MEPILTLPYSEWLVAEHLMRAFPSKAGYSVYAPLSRQQKSVDLLIARRRDGRSRVAALQVKYSRAFEQKPTSQFTFGTLFKRFEVGNDTDFFILVSLYPNVTGRGGGNEKAWWVPFMLVFERQEMADLIGSLRTRSGKPERMFYFGYDSAGTVALTRGAAGRPDLTSHTFGNRLGAIKRFLDAG